MRVTEAPKAVTELAGHLIKAVQRALGFELDGTQDTLPLLDLYLEGLRGVAEESARLAVIFAGAYLGEVFRRELPAFTWFTPAEEHTSWRLHLRVPAHPNGHESAEGEEHREPLLAFSPMALVAECVQRARGDIWEHRLEAATAFKTVAADYLEAQGPVTEDDYYRLSYRFDVIDGLGALLARG